MINAKSIADGADDRNDRFVLFPYSKLSERRFHPPEFYCHLKGSPLQLGDTICFYNVNKVPVVPLEGFVRLFYQHYPTRSTLLLPIVVSPGAAILVRSLPMKSSKRLSRDETSTATTHMPASSASSSLTCKH